jgi:hypothetical protein
MNLVMQHPHPLACQQACYAMLAGRTLDEVIRDVGHANRMAVEDRDKIVKLYGLKLDVWHSTPVGSFGNGTPLGPLMKEHRTLLCSVNDYRDISFGHSVVIHDGDLYDPHDGMNPMYPWSRVFTHVSPAVLEAAED